MTETVYRIRNNINDMVYIGCSKDVYVRLLKHQSSLRCGRHTSRLFQSLYNDNQDTITLTIELIATYANDSDARAHESYLLYNETNLLNGGHSNTGGDMISNHPDRDAIVSKHKENYKSNINFQNKRCHGQGPENPNYRHGQAVSTRTCENCNNLISPYSKTCRACMEYDRTGCNNPFHGKHHTAETKAILSRARSGVPNLADSKKISVDGVTYRSLSFAASELNMVTGTLGYRCRSPNYPNIYYIE